MDRTFVKIIKSITVFGFLILGPMGPIGMAYFAVWELLMGNCGELRFAVNYTGGTMRIIDIFRRGQKPMSRAPPKEQAA